MRRDFARLQLEAEMLHAILGRSTRVRSLAARRAVKKRRQ
jgi:hypothetical protein